MIVVNSLGQGPRRAADGYERFPGILYQLAMMRMAVVRGVPLPLTSCLWQELK